MKRIAIFIVTNLLVLLLLSLSARLLGIDRYLAAHGLGWRHLLGFSLTLGVGGAFISLWTSRKLAYWALKMAPYAVLSPKKALMIQKSVKVHAIRAGIPMPDVAVYDGPPNALVTGRSARHALLALSVSLVDELSEEELDAVIAHEVAHIANGDMVTLALLQGVLNTFVLVSSRLACYALDGMFRKDEDLDLRPGWAYSFTHAVLMLLLGWVAASWVAWFSRRREFRADADAVRLIGSAQPLMQALARLDRLKNHPLPHSLVALAITDTSNQWFDTHPTLAARVDCLKSL